MSDNSRDGEERSAKRAKATGGLAVLMATARKTADKAKAKAAPSAQDVGREAHRAQARAARGGGGESARVIYKIRVQGEGLELMSALGRARKKRTPSRDAKNSKSTSGRP